MIDQILAEKSLRSFVEQAWHVVEPKTPFIHGWHVDAICDHLEAVTEGHIQDLLINIPPRHMKSLTVSVFWPCWEWGPRNMPHIRWLFASYAEKLSKRDSLKCRRLIQSPWYSERWADRFHLTSDQNEKLRFENDKTGYRIATSVGGVGTGEGGDRVVVDDPHNVNEAESDAKRTSVILWWDESMSTRIDNEQTGARVVIMQRVHEADLAGHVLAEEHGYVHLCLPARYEDNGGKRTVIDLGSKKFKDPRKEEGDLLWPERFPEEDLAKREHRMSEYAVAGQHQQRPAPRGGGLFKIDKFVLVNTVPANPNAIVKSIRYWDKAATQDGGKRSAGVLMHKLSNGQHLISDVRKGQWSAPLRERHIRMTAEMDGVGVEVVTEQEPGSGGKESAESTIVNLSGFKVSAHRPTGDKETRAEPYAVQIEAGNVQLLIADWTKDFINEHEKAPMGKFQDQWDAAAGAFNTLNVKRKRAGTW